MASVNSEALRQAVDYEIGRRLQRGPLVDQAAVARHQALLEGACQRIEAGKSLSDDQRTRLLEAVDSCLRGFAERERRRIAIEADLESETEETDLRPEEIPQARGPREQELIEALERSREGLASWPVLSPLSAEADVVVPSASSEIEL